MLSRFTDKIQFSASVNCIFISWSKLEEKPFEMQYLICICIWYYQEVIEIIVLCLFSWLKVCNSEEDYKSDVVIIGGLVESFVMVDNEVKNAGVVGLAFTGNVEAVSMVHHGETVEGVQESLKELRKCGITCNKNTACFMVSCIGRGQEFYHAKNVETGIFQQVFPGIPVVGFFGNGELGLDLHSHERDGHFLHSYSSVFCLCSLPSQSNDSLPAQGTVISVTKELKQDEKDDKPSKCTWLKTCDLVIKEP